MFKTFLTLVSLSLTVALPCLAADPVVTSPYVVTNHDAGGYGLWCHIHATDPDGNDDIVSATVTGPLGTVYNLDPAGDGQFTLYTVFGDTPPPLGDYTAVVVDASGNPSAPAVRQVDNVIEEITQSVYPQPDALVSTTTPTFHWTEVSDPEQPIVSYCIQVWSLSPTGGWDTMIWVYCSPNPVATYDSDGAASSPLIEGESYDWKAEAQDEDGNFSYDVGHLTIVPPEVSINDGLDAYWPFDVDGSDLSGNDHHATLEGGASISGAGRLGGALDLRGVDGWAAVPAGVLESTPACSVAFSVSTDSFSTPGCCIAVFATVDWVDYGGLHVNLFTHGTAAEMGVYGFPDSIVGATLGPHWTHLGFSYSALTGRMDMYVDGEWQAETVGGAGISCGDGLAAAIGAWDEDAIGSMSRFHDGRIDELRIYNRAITAEEVATLAHLHQIFSDGFEIGDTQKWSITFPTP